MKSKSGLVIQLDQIIKDININHIQEHNQQQKYFRNDVAWKIKTRNRTSHKQPASKHKIHK